MLDLAESIVGHHYVGHNHTRIMVNSDCFPIIVVGIDRRSYM